MKILIVCSNGLSTNVLRFRLQKYVAEQGLLDEFEACGINAYQDYKEADVICIAPQIQFMKKPILDFAQKNNIAVLCLNEKDISLMNISSIYDKISSLRKQNKKIEKDKIKQSFTKQTLIEIICYFGIFIALYLCLILITYLFNLHLKVFLLAKISTVFIYYIMLIIAIYYGKLKQINMRTSAILSIAITCLILNSSYYSALQNSDVTIISLFLSFKFYSLITVLFLIILVTFKLYIVTTNCIRKINKNFEIKGYNEVIICIPATVMIVFTIIVRLLLDL